MMTEDEILAVVAAYKKGMKIECRNKVFTTREWVDCVYPIWNFADCDYRVKPITRPYVLAELRKAIEEKGITFKVGEHFCLVKGVEDNGIKFYKECEMSFEELFKKAKWIDGTPFGNFG